MTYNEMKNFLFVSIISADNDSLEEDVKQDIMSRRKEKPDDWKYILAPIPEEDVRDKYIDLFTALEDKIKNFMTNGQEDVETD